MYFILIETKLIVFKKTVPIQTWTPGKFVLIRVFADPHFLV